MKFIAMIMCLLALGNPTIYESYEVTSEVLENRIENKELVIERCIGIVTSENGDGKILNTDDDYYNYISYRGCFKELPIGTLIKTYVVYSPFNNYVDDIILRDDIIITPSEAIGSFHWTHNDIYGNKYYQFKSYDDTVWWALTEEEMGFIPEANKTYTLTYYDNDTTIENKPCDCPPEYYCECEVYDDIFVAIREEN